MGTNDCRRRTSNMKLLAVLALASVAAAIPQGYHAPAPHVFEPAPPVVIKPSPTPSYGPCPTGTVRKGNGQCVRPVITRNLYLYKAPDMKLTYKPATHFPDPKVHYNHVFVRTPDMGVGPRPIVAPAPQQKTLVYLLSKRPGAIDQEVIEVPANPTNPEVYFVKYSDGENTQLPGGVDLQTALSQAAQQGQVITSQPQAPVQTYSAPQATHSQGRQTVTVSSSVGHAAGAGVVVSGGAGVGGASLVVLALAALVTVVVVLISDTASTTA